MDRPFMVGESVPGNCYIRDTWQGDKLRVEAVGVDWIVLRHSDGTPRWYAGSHADLRREVKYALKDRETIGTE